VFCENKMKAERQNECFFSKKTMFLRAFQINGFVLD